jgi:hypothetical protein
MKKTEFNPTDGSPKGELECPKRWGKVKFGENGRCPISGSQSCKDCDYKEKPEPPVGTVV